ncbi:MAG TPA: hypothetical protein VLJ17_01115 [Xanthobacteraceae bacterium]|nr:hypothetical protein [Xanthobacteraceae bacterium]
MLLNAPQFARAGLPQLPNCFIIGGPDNRIASGNQYADIVDCFSAEFPPFAGVKSKNVAAQPERFDFPAPLSQNLVAPHGAPDYLVYATGWFAFAEEFCIRTECPLFTAEWLNRFFNALKRGSNCDAIWCCIWAGINRLP